VSDLNVDRRATRPALQIKLEIEPPLAQHHCLSTGPSSILYLDLFLVQPPTANALPAMHNEASPRRIPRFWRLTGVGCGIFFRKLTHLFFLR